MMLSEKQRGFVVTRDVYESFNTRFDHYIRNHTIAKAIMQLKGDETVSEVEAGRDWVNMPLRLTTEHLMRLDAVAIYNRERGLDISRSNVLEYVLQQLLQQEDVQTSRNPKRVTMNLPAEWIQTCKELSARPLNLTIEEYVHQEYTAPTEPLQKEKETERITTTLDESVIQKLDRIRDELPKKPTRNLLLQDVVKKLVQHLKGKQHF